MLYVGTTLTQILPTTYKAAHFTLGVLCLFDLAYFFLRSFVIALTYMYTLCCFGNSASRALVWSVKCLGFNSHPKRLIF